MLYVFSYGGGVCGCLIGGNLVMFCVLLGIFFLFEVDGVLLFFEDISEVFYCVDCMFS